LGAGILGGRRVDKQHHPVLFVVEALPAQYFANIEIRP